MKRALPFLDAGSLSALLLTGCPHPGAGNDSVPTITHPPLTRVNLRLLWTPQAQFAGYIIAKQKGFYKDVGLDVNLLPAGPDLKPQVTVAAGTDDIGINVPNAIISARAHGVPLVSIAQIFQDSANRYVLKAKNRITSLRQLKGKKVGIWTGGDEVEFTAMLKTVGMSPKDVDLVPEGYSVTPFLKDQYVLSMVTVYNELNLIRREGYPDNKLQILSPASYNCAIDGDMIFTSEKYLNAHGPVVEHFLEGTLRGWKYCTDHPDEALDIILQDNKELKREDQRMQLKEVLALVNFRGAIPHGIGYIDPDDYATAERVLLESKLLTSKVDVNTIYNSAPWQAAQKVLSKN